MFSDFPDSGNSENWKILIFGFSGFRKFRKCFRIFRIPEIPKIFRILRIFRKLFFGLKSTRLGVLENSVFRGVRRFVFPKSVLVDVARTKAQIRCSFQNRYTFSRDVEKKAGKRYWKPLRAVLSCNPSKSTLASLFLFCCSKKSPQFTAKSPKVKS